MIVLTAGISRYTQLLFSRLIEETIAEKRSEIQRSVSDLYDPLTSRFDVKTVEALGMHFTHEGYITTVTDAQGGIVWDARICNMAECTRVLNEIRSRMNRFGSSGGTPRILRFPLVYAGRITGYVTVETFGPLFYSRGESVFLFSLDRLFFAALAVFTAVSIIIAVALATFILNKADKKQRQLTADVAHELRTPLACLQGSMEALTDGIWEPTPERLAGCSEEIQRLSKLITDLSLLTDIEWEYVKLHKTDFDLAELLETTAEQFRGTALKKGISIVLDVRPRMLYADYDRIRQVFVNILSNALKYTDSGSITIRTNGRETDISDTGIGIAPGELPHIFERFYRADKSRSRATGGSGIGLTIVYALVKAHGGDIRAESVPGKGSTFRVFL
jgi:two-component system, OmpR family, sensor histidine kinase BaeS